MDLRIRHFALVSWLVRLTLAVGVLGGLLALSGPTPLAGADACQDGQQASGAIYRICMPDNWNGRLVLYAHGFVAPDEPVAIPEDQLVLPDGTSVPELVNSLGFAFATTSYSKNGLAVLQGIEDLVDLVDIFEESVGEPDRVYLAGVSEGGLITALAVERFPDVFDGGLATCGPVGDFRKQLNYFGDFRVVFDYFFPGVIPGNPVHIPQRVMDDWDAVYVPRVESAIAADPSATEQLLRVTRAPVDGDDPGSVRDTVVGLLFFSVQATNDGTETLGGQPFDNSLRLYLGSDNDLLLNLRVKRFHADPAALQEIRDHYQTSGELSSPLVTLHTTGDPIVPYWHEPRYTLKTLLRGSFFAHGNIPVFRYGHCNFNVTEVVGAFALLMFRVELLGGP